MSSYFIAILFSQPQQFFILANISAIMVFAAMIIFCFTAKEPPRFTGSEERLPLKQ